MAKAPHLFDRRLDAQIRQYGVDLRLLALYSLAVGVVGGCYEVGGGVFTSAYLIGAWPAGAWARTCSTGCRPP